MGIDCVSNARQMIVGDTAIEIITIFSENSRKDYREHNDHESHFNDCKRSDGLVLSDSMILSSMNRRGTRPVFLPPFLPP